MTEDQLELRSAWTFPVINREKEYYLTAKLYKSKFVIEDNLGNKIALSKRLKEIKIERWGNVDWLSN